MDNIKESFNRVKEDITNLKVEMEEMRRSLIDLCQIIERISQKESKVGELEKSEIPTQNPRNQTNQHIITANSFENAQNIPTKQLFSTGNEGVPTDRQTDQQTDRHIETSQKAPDSSIDKAAEMLKSLDNIKKDLRQKFKKLTEQEWIVFSTIYQLDEENGHSDYKVLAARLNLTESSIRDYVGKLIKKGIPVDKIKQNNKNIHLKISSNLKQVASLSALITLRDL